MGSGGSSSGISNSGKPYGSEYRTLFEYENIKFVTKTERSSGALMETMTQGRIYVTVGGEELRAITYFDENNKRVKAIDLSHMHEGMNPHTHHGYFHNENDGALGAAQPTSEEMEMIDKVRRLWYNHLRKGK